MDSPPRGPRTKVTARKSTGSKPPRAVLAAEAKKRKADAAFKGDATGAGLDASNEAPKKRRAPAKKTAAPKAEKEAAVATKGAAAGRSRKPKAQQKETAPSQGTLSLRRLCDSVRTSQATAQYDVVQLLKEVEDFGPQFDAASEELAAARTEVDALRASNEELTRENMELRAERERLLYENAALRG